MKLIGFIVNPIAGLGGSVGLKGTDGNLYKLALQMGAKPNTVNIVNQFLNSLEYKKEIKFLAAPAQMGEDYLGDYEIEYEVVGEIGDKTDADDTKKIANLLIVKNVECIVFFGGDGTARDIFDAIGSEIPVIAVPSGVKMFSAVFAINPRAAAHILDTLVSDSIDYEEREILDIDENSYRKGILESKLYGFLKVPKITNLIQASKDNSRLGVSNTIQKKEIAHEIIENMENDAVYLLGPGTTVKAICDELKIPKTLLGIDAIYQNQVIGLDLNERRILKLIQEYDKFYIIISPIGMQGFIFGRGNKQFTPKILRIIGLNNIIVIATRNKLKELTSLRVDTGEKELDELFERFFRVIVGYKEEFIMPVR
jgi:predicted polyphosphate/ATP-dependent NAD kinase